MHSAVTEELILSKPICLGKSEGFLCSYWFGDIKDDAMLHLSLIKSIIIEIACMFSHLLLVRDKAKRLLRKSE